MSRSMPPLLQPGAHQIANATAGGGQAYPFAERRVTERRRPVLDWRQRDVRLRAAVRVTGVGLYDFDAAARSSYWSPELKAMAGIADDPDEISMERLASLMHPEDRGRVMEKIEASLDPMGSGCFEEEYRLLRSDGEVRWVKARGRTFFGGDAQERHAVGASGIVIDVTERRATEALLREQSEELRLALRVGNSGTFQWDARTHEHRWCDEMLALYGLERREFGGGDEDWLARLLPEDRGHAMAAVERSLKIGEYATAFRIRRRQDGEIRWISARGKVSFDRDGNPVRMVGINVDITDQKRDQEKLQESEARFRLMADAAPALIRLVGTDKGCLWFNQPWLDFSGCTMEEELGYGWARRLHPDDVAPTLKIYEAAFDRREPFSLEYRLRRHDGHYRWLLDQGIPRFEGETFVGYVGAAIDITDYKQVQASGEETRTRLTAILDNLSEGVVVFDLGGQVLNMNPAARRMLRYATPEEARRRLPEFTETFDVRALDGRSLPLEEWPIGRVMRGESFNDYEIVLYRKDDGSTRIISHNGTPVSGPAGEILVGVLTLWDVTDRKRDERALQESEEKYRTLFSNMTEGFGLGEPILDQDGRPVDLRYLEVNEAFHQHSGIPRGVTGRPISKILPQVEKAWIERFGAVAQTGKADRFESYNIDTGRCYDVYAFQPSPGRFAVLFRDITESKRAEARLRESEEELWKFKFFSDHANDGHLIIDEAGRIRYANRTLCARVGYGEAEVLGMGIADIDPAYPKEAFQALFERAKLGRTEPFETAHRCKDGTSVPIEVSVTVLPVKDEWMMFAVSRDITERKRGEQALQESARRLTVALEASGSAVWEMDVADGHVRGEKLLFTMLGYEPGELKSLADWHALVHAEDQAGISGKVEEVIGGKRDSCRFEVRVRAKDGHWRWILSQAAAAERDAQGRAVRLVGTHTDIDERKQVEEALRRESSRLQSILDNAPLLISIKDLHGRMVLANRAIFETVDVPPPERFIGRSVFELFPQEVAEQLWANDLSALEADGPVKAEERVRHRDGSLHTYLTIKFPVRDVYSGKSRSVCAISLDITERKAAEAKIVALNNELELRVQERTAELRQANEALLQSNMELKQFAHATAHDLQTPLRSIAGFTQLLQREAQGRGSERVDQLSSLVVENTKRLQVAIGDLLTYTRLETDSLPVEQVDLRRLAEAVLASLAVLIEESGAVVSCGDLPTLPVDRNQLAMVLQNLVENAIKYNRSKPPRVSIDAQRQGGEWVISVADNGMGIEPRYHERIFEIFRRLHAYHRVPGSGIGLALCRRIVERHGGRIWVESRPGEGSTFRFTLPVRDSAD